MKSYKPSGVCSKEIQYRIQDGKVQKVHFVGGCPGNLLGLSLLVEGLAVEEAVEKLKGIRCGSKATSCPDQLARALGQEIK